MTKKTHAYIRVFSERITVQQLFTGKFSAREPKWLTGVALVIGIVSTCKETTREILRLGLKRCSVFGNIYVTRALFCQPVSLQILNCMPAITLLFPLLNTNQIWNNVNQSDVAGKYCYVTIMPYLPWKTLAI